MSRLLLLVPTTTYRAEAFVRASRDLPVDVTIATDKSSALARYVPESLIRLDFSRPERCADRMRTFARRHPIGAVVPVDDQATLAASAIGEALSLPHNPIDAAYAARNKHRMRQRLSEAGVPVPAYRLISIQEDVEMAARRAEYPCVLKPLMMAASRGVIRADGPKEFADAFRRIAEIIQGPDAPKDEEARSHILVEAYVPGWEVAVEGILSEGRLHVLAIFDKPDPLEGPYFPETIYITPSRLDGPVRERIVATTQNAARALGLRHGPIHAELRGTENQLWFLEIAARSIGGYCSKVLRFDDGSSLEDAIIRHALGTLDPPPRREARAAGVYMIQAPRAGVFEGVVGLEAARAVPNIDEVIVSAHPGEKLSPLPEGFLYAGFIFSRAETPDDVDRALRTAYHTLDFVITPPASQR